MNYDTLQNTIAAETERTGDPEQAQRFAMRVLFERQEIELTRDK